MRLLPKGGMMDLFDVATKRSVPGIIILNHRKKLEFFNQSALDFISILEDAKPSKQRKPSRLLVPPTVIIGLYDNIVKGLKSMPPSADIGHGCLPTQIVLVPTQETTFCCRGFFIDARQLPLKKTFHIMILIERISPERYGVDFDKLKPQYGLTNRQLEIVKPLMSGASNKELANRLCVSEDTIKGHLKHIMSQMGVSSRTELLSLLFQHQGSK
jgi:DNA-binding CsgD family transcriptional regulator